MILVCNIGGNHLKNKLQDLRSTGLASLILLTRQTALTVPIYTHLYKWPWIMKTCRRNLKKLHGKYSEKRITFSTLKCVEILRSC